MHWFKYCSGVLSFAMITITATYGDSDVLRMLQSQSLRRSGLPPGLPATCLLAQIAFSDCPGVAVLSQTFPGETQNMSLHPREGARTDQSSTNVQFAKPVHFFWGGGVLIRLWVTYKE